MTARVRGDMVTRGMEKGRCCLVRRHGRSPVASGVSGRLGEPVGPVGRRRQGYTHAYPAARTSHHPFLFSILTLDVSSSGVPLSRTFASLPPPDAEIMWYEVYFPAPVEFAILVRELLSNLGMHTRNEVSQTS